MFKLKNLVSIHVPYRIDEALRGKGMASSVMLTFASLKSATAFCGKMNPDSLAGTEKFHVSPPVQGDNGATVILELTGNEKIWGRGADVILDVLKTRYILSPTFNISYPEHLKATTVKNVTVAMKDRAILGQTLKSFLEIQTLEDSNLCSRFANTLGVAPQAVTRIPAVNNNQSSLELKFGSPNDILSFKKQLYDHALKYGFDEEYTIQKIKGVAGNEHTQLCRIDIKPGYCFQDVLTKLVKDMQPLPQENANQLQ